MNPLVKLKIKHKLRRIKYSLINRPKIKAKNAVIGKNVVFGKNVEITAKNVFIGDGCIIGDNVIVRGDTFEIGDYGTVYQNSFFPGGKVKVGRNFWLGSSSIVDGCAGTVIGDNVGIGAQSQLWTHMAFGDVMQGCRFHSETALTIGNDVWLTGHNLVSPVTIGDRSLAMLGSLITKDMLADKTYGGSPAKDLTDKIGTQFEVISLHQKKEILINYLEKFCLQHNLGDFSNYININPTEFGATNRIDINIENRSYVKTGSVLEFYLLRYLLPDIKLTPAE